MLLKETKLGGYPSNFRPVNPVFSGITDLLKL